MTKYKITSGEFVLVVQDEGSPYLTALLAIQLHIESKHHTDLGQITMVEKHRSNKTEEALFFSTDSLIEELLENNSVNLESFILG